MPKEGPGADQRDTTVGLFSEQSVRLAHCPHPVACPPTSPSPTQLKTPTALQGLMRHTVVNESLTHNATAASFKAKANHGEFPYKVLEVLRVRKTAQCRTQTTPGFLPLTCLHTGDRHGGPCAFGTRNVRQHTATSTDRRLFEKVLCFSVPQSVGAEYRKRGEAVCMCVCVYVCMCVCVSVCMCVCVCVERTKRTSPTAPPVPSAK